jgi:hypothetical protein
MNWLWLFSPGLNEYMLVNMDKFTIIARGPNGEGSRLAVGSHFDELIEDDDATVYVRETPEKIRSKLIELRRPA